MSEETDSPTSEETDGGSTGSEPRTYTQEELNRIVTQRVQKSKAQFKNFDDYKQAAERLAQLEAQNQTESERLRAQVEKATQEAQAASEREKAANARANDTLVRSEVIRRASLANVADPDDAYVFLSSPQYRDRFPISVDEAGNVTGVEEAVTGLLTEKPNLAARVSSGGFDGGARQTAPAVSSAADFNAQLRREAGFA